MMAPLSDLKRGFPWCRPSNLKMLLQALARQPAAASIAWHRCTPRPPPPIHPEMRWVWRCFPFAPHQNVPQWKNCLRKEKHAGWASGSYSSTRDLDRDERDPGAALGLTTFHRPTERLADAPRAKRKARSVTDLFVF